MKSIYQENKDFDIKVYHYVRSKYTENSDKNYSLLIDFYQSYLISGNMEILYGGLLEEYIYFLDELIKKFEKKKSRIKLEERKALYFLQGYLYLIIGKLQRAIEVFCDLELFNFETLEIIPTHYAFIYNNKGDAFEVKKLNSISPYTIICVFYLLFHKLDFKKGKDYILDGITIKFNEIEENSVPIETHYYSYEQIFEIYDKSQIRDIKMLFISIDRNENNKLFVPKKYSVRRNSHYSIEFDEELFLDIDEVLYYVRERYIKELDNLTFNIFG